MPPKKRKSKTPKRPKLVNRMKTKTNYFHRNVQKKREKITGNTSRKIAMQIILCKNQTKMKEKKKKMRWKTEKYEAKCNKLHKITKSDNIAQSEAEKQKSRRKKDERFLKLNAENLKGKQREEDQLKKCKYGIYFFLAARHHNMQQFSRTDKNLTCHMMLILFFSLLLLLCCNFLLLVLQFFFVFHFVGPSLFRQSPNCTVPVFTLIKSCKWGVEHNTVCHIRHPCCIHLLASRAKISTIF